MVTEASMRLLDVKVLKVHQKIKQVIYFMFYTICDVKFISAINLKAGTRKPL